MQERFQDYQIKIIKGLRKLFLEDLAELSRDWGKSGSGLIGDISGENGITDGNVNLQDFAIMAKNYTPGTE